MQSTPDSEEYPTRELAKRIETRIDRLENKIDKHLEQTSAHAADIQWIRGYIRISIMAFVSLTGGLVTTLIKMYTA